MNDNLFLIGGGILLVAAVIFDGGIGNTQDVFNTGSRIKDLRESAQISALLSQQKQENIQATATEADARYSGGQCVVHAIKAAKQKDEHMARGVTTLQYEAIKEGGTYSHWTGVPYADNTCLVDAWGNTGIVENGALAYHAFTPNKKLVMQAVQDFPRY